MGVDMEETELKLERLELTLPLWPWVVWNVLVNFEELYFLFT